MTELLVGTKKGLFVLEGEGDEFAVTTRQFAGEPVEYAMRDPHSGRYFAAVCWLFIFSICCCRLSLVKRSSDSSACT